MEPTGSLPPPPQPTQPPVAPVPAQVTGSTARIIYVLYLVSLVLGVTALIGVVMAYVNVHDGPAALQTHYRLQIRTFWIGVLYSVIGFLTLVVGVGFLVFPLVAVWMIVRCVKGLKHLERFEPYPNPATWLW